MKILFFGDSLTDMWRNRDEASKEANIYGVGYVFNIASKLYYFNAGQYQVINKGCGGDKITDLYNRYKEDVIGQKPDILTILIGINDVWHGLNDPSQTTPIDAFEKLYVEMIEDIKNKLPNIKIILMEPFFINGYATINMLEGFKDVYRYAKVVKLVADKTDSTFLPLQKSFNLKAKGNNEAFLYDGVHTAPGGAYLIAKKWLKTFNRIK